MGLFDDEETDWGEVFWDVLPAAIDIGGSYLASEQAAKGVEKGAEEQARMEALNRAYQQKIFDENIERMKPFYEAGIRALPKYEQALRGELDPTESGMYQEQMGLLEPDLEGAPAYVQEQTRKRIGAETSERQKGKLLDLMQIGMGASGAAGRASVNLGSALAQSYGTSGNVQAAAERATDISRQSAWGKTLDQLSGIPAYFASRSQAPPSLSTSFERQSRPGGMGGY